MAVFVTRVTPKHENYKFLFFTGEGDRKKLDDSCDLHSYIRQWRSRLSDKENISFEFCAVKDCESFKNIDLQNDLAGVCVFWLKGKCVVSVSYGHPDQNRKNVKKICPKPKDTLTDFIWELYQDCISQLADSEEDEDSSDEDSSSSG